MESVRFGQVARDFDLTEATPRSWVKQPELDAATRSDGLTSDERSELARLRHGSRWLRLDVDILKRATTFFGRSGDVYPFIAAEQVGKHNVKRAWELLEVS